MEGVKDLRDLLVHYIQILYAAEGQAAHLLTDMVEKARHRSLKNALQHHLGLTKEHRARLEKVMGLINEKMGSGANAIGLDAMYVSKAMEGLINEAKGLMDSELAADVNDAVIIGCVQAIEHNEICAYGTAIAYAKQLQLHNVEELLKETLDEEYDADDLLTALATASLNKEALPEGITKPSKTDTETGGDTNEEDEMYEGGGRRKSGSERTINSPGGRAGTSHRGYSSGESRGH